MDIKRYLMKNKVKFDGEMCLKECNYIDDAFDVDTNMEFIICLLFDEEIKKMKRCQQCLEIFGE